jgi:hypothetical protein
LAVGFGIFALTLSNLNPTISMDEHKSGLELAKSSYTLVEPVAASESLWDAYTAERRAVQEAFSTVLLSGEADSEEEEEETDYGVVQMPHLFTLF